MSPYLSVMLLLLLVGTLFVLPLTPALAEFVRKSDATPLNVIQDYTGEIRVFADGFRSYIKSLEPALRDSADSGTPATGILPDGTRYQVVGHSDEGLKLLLEQRNICPVLIAASEDLELPSDTTFSKEIYAAGHLVGGEKGRYRAILGEKGVHLGPASSVLRWAHAVGELRADQGCKLYGRASSDQCLSLQRNCSFQRLNAPRIEIATHTSEQPPSLANPAAEADSRSLQRLLIDGSFSLDRGETLAGNLVVRGSLRIGAGARIFGDLKGGKRVILEDNVSVQGSLISNRELRIGPNCAIQGPIIAERFLQIQTGTRCGSPEHPTTVSAPRIEVEEGAVVFGTLWAREHGQVVAKS